MFVFNKFPAFHCRTIAFKARNFAFKSDLPHFRCRLGGSTRGKSLYPRSLGTDYRPFGRFRFSGPAVRGLMDATPVCSTGWRCATVSRLHRKCGRTLKSHTKWRVNFVSDLSTKWRSWETASPEDWSIALEREAVIRPLAEQLRLSQAIIESAAQRLRLSRIALYRLLRRYRQRPQTSYLGASRN
jgi:hypothetical protein